MERGTLIAGFGTKNTPILSRLTIVNITLFFTFQWEKCFFRKLFLMMPEGYFYQKYSNGPRQQSPIIIVEERMDLYCEIKQWGLRIHYTATIFHLAEFSLNTHLHFNAWIAQHSSPPPPPLLNLFGDSFAYDCINLAVTANYLGRGRGRENSFKLM